MIAYYFLVYFVIISINSISLPQISATIIGIATNQGTLISSTCGIVSNGVKIQDDYEWVHRIGDQNIIIGLHVRIAYLLYS